MKKSKLLYYLDDDTDDLNHFKETADSLGQRTVTFQNGNELLYALRLHSQTSEKADIIFLDIHMPILNGEEMLNILKKSDDFKHIPVVMISGAYPKKLVRQYIESGANYLMKKYTGNDLKKALEQVVNIDFKKFDAADLLAHH